MKLKNLLLPLIVSAGLNTVKAQQVQTDTGSTLADTIEIKQEDQSVEINKLYAGMFGIFNVDDAEAKNGKPTLYTDLRVGGKATWHLNDKMKVRSALGFDRSGGDEKSEYIISTYDLSYEPIDGLTLDAGKIPLSATHMIGIPFTAGGHFLVTPETKVPLPSLGAKLTYEFDGNTISGSVGQKDGFVEPSFYASHTGERLGTISGAVAYNTTSKEFQGGLSRITDFDDKSNVFSIAWVNPESLSAAVQWTSKEGPRPFDKFGIFVDTDYTFDTKKLDHIQIGVIKDKPFKGEHGTLDVKIGASYEAVKGVVQGILFINLNK